MKLSHSFAYLAAAAGICIVVLAFFYAFQSHLVYFPDRRIIATPHEIGLPYDSVHFRAEDGVDLAGWLVPVEHPRGVVLFCHGNAGNISNCLESIQIFSRMGFSTFIFDYRGFGESGGKPSERGTYLDARAAWSYLVETMRVSPDRIVLFGRSLGGAVAAWLAQSHQPAALIIESTFTSVPDLAAKLYPFLPARLLSRFSYDTASYLSRVSSPVLVVHSCEDDIVPYYQGCRLYDVVKAPKEFLEIRGDHNTGFMLTEEAYTKGLDGFISRYIPK